MSTANVDVVCYKSKILKNGEHPLMIRITKDGKREYKSLGISINSLHWNFQKNTPKRNCPTGSSINQIILNRRKEYEEQILGHKIENKDYTIKSLIEKVNNPIKIRTVLEMLNTHIDSLKSKNRDKYAETFQLLRNSLIKFNGHLDIYFSEIDVSFLRKY